MKKLAIAALVVLLVWQAPAPALAQQEAFFEAGLPLGPRQPTDLLLGHSTLAGLERPQAMALPLGLKRQYLKKQVVVHLREGGSHTGKLVKLTGESLSLRVPGRRGAKGKALPRIQQIAFTEVFSVGRAINPKLVGKKVVVRLHNGRAYQGRMTELGNEYLVLQMQEGAQEIALPAVAEVRRKPVQWRKALEIAAGAGVVAGVVVLTIATCIPERPETCVID